jgi:hypothetical protein
MDFFRRLPPLNSKMLTYILLFLCLLQIMSCVRLVLWIYRNRPFLVEKARAILSFLSPPKEEASIIVGNAGHAPAPFIYINSWPGVGKHMIAKSLASQLGDQVQLVCIHSISGFLRY